MAKDWLLNTEQLIQGNQSFQTIGRDREIDRLIEILCCKIHKNPILIGKPGVGKTSILFGLATKLDRVSHDKLHTLSGFNCYYVSLSDLLANYANNQSDMFESILESINQSNDKIILIIDNVDMICHIDNLLKQKFLLWIKRRALRGKVQLVLSMNESTFNSIIKQDEFFEKYFHVFLISPPNDKTILRILKSNTAKIKKQLEINIPEEIYENIITLARCYLSCHSLPASAINLLDSVIVRHLNENKQSTITLANLKNMIADWNNSSIGGLRLITDDNLISCGMIFDQEIYGQPHIWPIISDCLLRSKYYLRKESGTTSLIFAGPKGVGKIKAAYLLANCLGALDDQILHIDLAKFTSKTDIEKFKEILQKPNAKQIYYPYIVCILENIELANHNILLEIENIILSGEINNFDLSNTIWILTTENDLHIKYSESFSDLVHSTENKNIQLVVQTLPGSKAYNRTIKREEITKMIEKIKSRLLKIFDANFVNSITILPFTDLSQNIFAKYLLDQLRKLAGQLRETYDIELFYNYNLHERFIELIKKSDRSISDIKKKFNHDIIQNIRGLIFSEIDKQLSSRKISLSIDDDGKIICKFVYE